MIVSPSPGQEFDRLPGFANESDRVSSSDDPQRPRDAERRRLLQLRDDLPDVVRADQDRRIVDRLGPLVREKLRGTAPPWKIGGYWPIRNEPDIRPLLHELTKGGHRIGLPLVDRVQRPLTFVHWKPQSAMAPGFLGVPVPTSGNAVYVELLLVPCLGFSVRADGVLHRLGYGGGLLRSHARGAPLQDDRHRVRGLALRPLPCRPARYPARLHRHRELRALILRDLASCAPPAVTADATATSPRSTRSASGGRCDSPGSRRSRARAAVRASPRSRRPRRPFAGRSCARCR